MSDLPTYELVIGGKDVPAKSGGTFESLNPYTGGSWARVADGGPEDVDLAVNAARAALDGGWAQTSGFARALHMRRVADLIVENAEELARCEVNDTGKLMREMLGQVRGVSAIFHYYAGLADKVEGRQIPTPNPNYLVYTRREPVGVIAAITAWNSPLILLAMKLAPALAAGCTVVAKPSEHASVSTLEFAKLFEHAGFPPGVFNVVAGAAPEIGAHLAGHPGVNKVAFTGSVPVGRKVARAAGENLARITLELGGKSPQVVFADANLEAAASGIVAGIFAAAGQSCIAGSRLIVEAPIADRLLDAVVARASKIKLGDPNQPDTEMGPIANAAQYQRILDFLQIAAKEGATVACGGGPVERLGGLFIEPTVITNLPPSSRILAEEIFGPVLAVTTFTTEAEALKIANHTAFGLGAGVWTKDIHRAHTLAAGLHAGTVWVNCYRMASPSVPGGGFGISGIGRESGIEAIDEYLETKAVWIELAGGSRDPFVLG